MSIYCFSYIVSGNPGGGKEKKNTHLSPGLALAQLFVRSLQNVIPFWFVGYTICPWMHTQASVSFRAVLTQHWCSESPFFHIGLMLANPLVSGYGHFQNVEQKGSGFQAWIHSILEDSYHIYTCTCRQESATPSAGTWCLFEIWDLAFVSYKIALGI